MEDSVTTPGVVVAWTTDEVNPKKKIRIPFKKDIPTNSINKLIFRFNLPPSETGQISAWKMLSCSRESISPMKGEIQCFLFSKPAPFNGQIGNIIPNLSIV